MHCVYKNVKKLTFDIFLVEKWLTQSREETNKYVHLKNNSTKRKKFVLKKVLDCEISRLKFVSTQYWMPWDLGYQIFIYFPINLNALNWTPEKESVNIFQWRFQYGIEFLGIWTKALHMIISKIFCSIMSWPFCWIVNVPPFFDDCVALLSLMSLVNVPPFFQVCVIVLNLQLK